MDIISILIGITVFSVIICLIVMYIALQEIAAAMQETEKEEEIELERCPFCGFLTDAPCDEPPAAFCEQAIELMGRSLRKQKY